jgi:hypothetical protein
MESLNVWARRTIGLSADDGGDFFVAITWLLILRLPALPGREATRVEQLRAKAAVTSE